MIQVTSIVVRSPYLIYGLTDPRTKEVRYVGKSTSGLERPKKHFCPSTLKREACTYRVNRKTQYYESSEWGIKRSRAAGGRAVVEVSSGVVYGSVSEAARSLGLNPGNIANVLRGRQIKTGGYHFKYSGDQK